MGRTADILLEINSPEDAVFTGKVESVTLPGVCGSFMVLRNHAPLITALEEGEIKYVAGGDESRIKIESGFAEVYKNRVSVCAEL